MDRVETAPEATHFKEKIITDWCIFIGGLSFQGLGLSLENPILTFGGGTAVVASGVLMTYHMNKYENAIVNQQMEDLHER